MKFQFSLIVLSSLVSTVLSATGADVITDARSIVARTTALDSAVVNFPNSGGSLTAALAIHTDAVDLGSVIDKGTADIISTPKPFSKADGTTILNIVQTFEHTIVRTLSEIVTKKAALTALPVGGIPALVRQDLINLNASVSRFETRLIDSVPSNLVASAKSITATINTAFANAIAAYYE